MAFCASCGTQVDGKFCPKCGAPAPDRGQAPPPSQPAAGAGLETNVASALCYLVPVLSGVLFLVLEPYNKNKGIRFHAFQAIFTWISVTVAYWVMNFVLGSMSLFSYGAFALFGLIQMVFGLGSLVLWAMLMYKAYNNERWVLPVVGPLAEKQA